ncbi:hypothetical protein F5Y12DRAFT_77515 [Xylaria sp. FL1777]|nr:hypothetical protein F5Y12DRAFT_77515 [Xylaria sp. FL1777]
MEKITSESCDSLIPQCDCASPTSWSRPPKQTVWKPLSSWGRTNILLSLLLLLLFYIAVAVTIGLAVNGCDIPSSQIDNDHPALLGYDLEYERRTEWYPTEAPFDLEPSDELDTAWDDLLYAINVRLTADELRRVGVNMTNRVQVNGGDYLGSMGVYHHLHCLNNLRMVVHWDYYKSKWENYSHPEQFATEHTDHCINSLRQAVMCRPNTAITTFEWIDEVNALEGKVQRLDEMANCAKWDSFDDWARKKALVKGKFTYRPGPFANRQEVTGSPSE